MRGRLSNLESTDLGGLGDDCGIDPLCVTVAASQAMRVVTQHCKPRALPAPREPFMWLSGLEDLVVTKDRFQFLNVGER